MLAVEEHVKRPFDAQLGDRDFREYQDTTDVVTRLSALTERHIVDLRGALDRLGGHEAAPAKNTVTGFEGVVAGLIDKVRKTKISKALRDDYAALAFAVVSYSELLATANGLGDLETGTLAARHLEDYAGMLMELGECIPAVVVRELSEDGIQVDRTSSERTRSQIENAWRSRAQAEHGGGLTSETRSYRGDIGLEQDEPIGSPQTKSV
jgi:ferritin-like metal-binding protein YciE